MSFLSFQKATEKEIPEILCLLRSLLEHNVAQVQSQLYINVRATIRLASACCYHLDFWLWHPPTHSVFHCRFIQLLKGQTAGEGADLMRVWFTYQKSWGLGKVSQVGLPTTPEGTAETRVAMFTFSSVWMSPLLEGLSGPHLYVLNKEPSKARQSCSSVAEQPHKSPNHNLTQNNVM